MKTGYLYFFIFQLLFIFLLFLGATPSCTQQEKTTNEPVHLTRDGFDCLQINDAIYYNSGWGLNIDECVYTDGLWYKCRYNTYNNQMELLASGFISSPPCQGELQYSCNYMQENNFSLPLRLNECVNNGNSYIKCIGVGNYQVFNGNNPECFYYQDVLKEEENRAADCTKLSNQQLFFEDHGLENGECLKMGINWLICSYNTSLNRYEMKMALTGQCDSREQNICLFKKDNGNILPLKQGECANYENANYTCVGNEQYQYFTGTDEDCINYTK